MDARIKIDINEKVTLRLLDIIEKSFGAAFRAWLIRRDEKAKAEALADRMRILAKAERDVLAIENGLADSLSSSGNTNVLRVEPQLRSPQSTGSGKYPRDNVTDFLLDQTLRREHRQLRNTADAIAEAAQRIAENENGEASDDDNKVIDIDWFERWRSGASHVSDEDIRRLWGKVLAEEALKPGTSSFRLLSFLQQLSRQEADLISRVFSKVLSGSFIFIADSDEKSGIRFDDLLVAQALGLITGVEALGGLSKIFKSDEKRIVIGITQGKKALIVESPCVDDGLSLPAYPLTPLGEELFRLHDQNTDEAHLRWVAKKLPWQKATVSIADIKYVEKNKFLPVTPLIKLRGPAP